jgi:hypothetical protein
MLHDLLARGGIEIPEPLDLRFGETEPGHLLIFSLDEMAKCLDVWCYRLEIARVLHG